MGQLSWRTLLRVPARAGSEVGGGVVYTDAGGCGQPVVSIGIAIAIALLLVLVLLGLFLLGIGLIMLLLRARGAALPPEPAPRPAARVETPPAAPRSVPPPAPRPTPRAEAPPRGAGSGLLGFFDDEAFVAPGAGSQPREVEAAKTELFQRGKMAIDWDDDDSDEGEATEIFSAHGAAGDLAEFAFDDDDQGTGRFNS